MQNLVHIRMKIKLRINNYKINLGQHTFVPVLIHTFGDSESLR